MLSRRDFLKSTLAATALGAVPEVWGAAAHAAVSDGVHNDAVLVVVQLAGGNDGLNTVVPYANPAYYRLRPSIGVPGGKVLRLDAGVGLHPALQGIKTLYDAGKVAIVRGAGYPKFTYSHFDATRVYQQADPAHGSTGDGWLGHTLAGQSAGRSPLGMCALGQVRLPGELRAAGTEASVIGSAADYDFTSRRRHPVKPANVYGQTPGAYGAVLDAALATADAGIAAVHAAGRGYTPRASYSADPGAPTWFGETLRLAAELIVAGTGAKVVHVSLGGFDDHAGEAEPHATRLAVFDHAVAGFFADIAAHGASSRVAMLTWSEFGRRPKENSSGGTDHGTSQPMFLIGDPVRGGRLVGDEPSLTDLHEDNLRMTTDFRSVYQSVIADYLGADPRPVLGGSFPRLSLFR